jgi:hypothetical protein
MQILVLGMHRSGTSAVIRLLNMMGAWLGPPERVKGANPENPKGFWENDDIVELDNKVLAAQRCLWNRLSEFDPARLADDKLATLRRRARDQVIRLDASRPWAVKDPRMCLLLPFWRPLLELPVCVLVERSPIEAAQSLRTRNDIPLHVGIALWELHSLEALRGSSGLPRILVHYPDVVNDPVGATRRLFEQLGELGVRRLECPSEGEITAFIDPRLRRERTTFQDQEDLFTPPQRALSSALADGTAMGWAETDLQPFSRGARESLKTYDALLQCQLEIQQLKSTLEHREKEVGDIRKSLTDSRQAQDRLETELSEAHKDLQRIRRYDAGLEKSINAMREDLQKLSERLTKSGRKAPVRPKGPTRRKRLK